MNSQLLPEDYIFLKKKGIFYKIFVDDIAYFEASGDYLKVQLTDDRQYTSQANLSVLEGKLADDIFMRIHRSYLIKLSQIDAIDFVKCELRICESWLPFSRTKKQELKDLVESRKLEM